MVRKTPGAASAIIVGSISDSPFRQWICVRKNIHPPPMMSHAHDSAPDTTPLCHGDRMNSTALHGHQTNVGTMNHPW